jgi:hypothetical protein
MLSDDPLRNTHPGLLFVILTFLQQECKQISPKFKSEIIVFVSQELFIAWETFI